MAYQRANLSTYREDSPAHGLCGCCCCLSLSFLLLMIVGIGIALFFILALRPTKPQFHLESANIHNFDVEKHMQGPSTNIDSNDAIVSANITLVFLATNPNKVAIDYIPTNLTCVYRNVTLGEARVPFFHQAPRGSNALTVIVIANHLNVLQPSSIDLINDITADTLVLDIIGLVEARVKVIGINSPKVKV